MKIRTNARFKEKHPILPEPDSDLPAELQQIVSSAIINDAGAFVVKYLRDRDTNADRMAFSETDWECFINHFHLDDFCDDGLLEKAIYCDKILRDRIKDMFGRDMMRSIISLDESGCVFRWHLIRGGAEWVNEELDGYTEEDVIVIEGSGRCPA